MSDPSCIVKLNIIKNLLRGQGLLGDVLSKAMANYETAKEVVLDQTIEIMSRFMMPISPGEGTSSQPHAGVETSLHAPTTTHR